MWRPKLRRIACDSAFEPSMMNSRGIAGSSPRSIRSSMSAWTTAAFSVAPSASASGCLTPCASIPIAAISTRLLGDVDAVGCLDPDRRSCPSGSFIPIATGDIVADFPWLVVTAPGRPPAGSRPRLAFRLRLGWLTGHPRPHLPPMPPLSPPAGGEKQWVGSSDP